jgi:IMP dehydrogenase
MKEYLSFDDVLITPKFSEIYSRKDVHTSTFLCGEYFLPVISSNMDSVTGPEMAKAMAKNNAKAALHRFCSIEENVEMFKSSLTLGWPF